jgi:hypothetical protein
MAKRKRSIRPEFWAVLIFLALLAYSLIANWWKEHALLGWVIVIILVALLAFSLYRFPAFRGLFIRTAKKAGESMVYGTEASGREPLSSDLREHILKRAHYKCENPDCKAHIKPHIHHIDGDNSNCHTKAHHGVYSNSQLRNWVQRSWATFKSGRQRFR